MKPSGTEKAGIGMALTLAAILFFFLFGVEYLDLRQIHPYLSGDAAIHFFGFNFFNQEPWGIPLGKTALYSFPEGSSIVYTDSIPLASLLTKLFAVPGLLQFFGPWILLCFLLQGALGFYLGWKQNRSLLLGWASAFFCLTLPTFLNRTYDSTRHYALFSHFLILSAIALFESDRKKSFLLWAFLLLTALSVAFYLFIIVAIFFMAAEWQSLKEIRLKPRQGALALVLVGWAYLVGYFTIPIGNSVAGGFGLYSMNLNSLINANHRFWLSGLPYENALQRDEGFQYLGVGLLLAAIAVAWTSWKNRKATIECQGNETLSFGLLFLTLSAFSFRLSIGSVVLGEWFTIPLYALIFFFWFTRRSGTQRLSALVLALVSLGAMFALGKVARATGRLFWPVEYLFIFYWIRSKPSLKWLALIVVIQCIDVQPFLQKIRDQNRGLLRASIPALSSEWKTLVQGKKQISLIDAGVIFPFSLTMLAYENRLGIGPMGVARASGGFRAKEQSRLKQEIFSLDPLASVLYIVGAEETWKTFQEKCSLDSVRCAFVRWGDLDGYHYVRKP